MEFHPVGEARKERMKMLKSFAFGGGINQIIFIQIYVVSTIKW